MNFHFYESLCLSVGSCQCSGVSYSTHDTTFAQYMCVYHNGSGQATWILARHQVLVREFNRTPYENADLLSQSWWNLLCKSIGNIRVLYFADILMPPLQVERDRNLLSWLITSLHHELLSQALISSRSSGHGRSNWPWPPSCLKIRARDSS